jgi:oligoendopeptidase F
MKTNRAPRCVHLVAAVAATLAIVASLPAGADDATWDLSELYADVASWEKARDQLPSRFAELEPYRGTLSDGASNLEEALALLFDVRKEFMRLNVYASMLSDMDLREAGPQGMSQSMVQLGADLRTKIAWIDPEILTIPAETIDGFLESEPGLKPYRRYLERLNMKRAHMLDTEGEELMGLGAMVAGDGDTVGGLLLDAEIPWKTITLVDGSQLRVDVSGYARGRASANRLDRIGSYAAFYSQLDAFKQTLAAALANTVKMHLVNTRARSYDDTLDASLSPSEIDTAVYNMLVEEVNHALPTLQRYLKLRARMLGISDLGYHDLYPPLVGEVEAEYSWEKTKELVLDSFAPLGQEYVEYVQHALDNRWVDVFPRDGKRSGAYMSGSAYDVHPYMLLNHQDDYRCASTLAHEAGHMMHSAFSSKAQPYPTARYDTFVAEVASVTNEWLFFDHNMKLAGSDREKLAILGHFLEGARTTVFRQTMFAEFERLIHQEVEQGRPLTADRMNEIYLDLLRRYHGHDDGVCTIDERYAVEWAFIPHFHYNYYVYAYATSFIAGTAFSDQILSGTNGGVERYMDNLLSAGSSQAPVQILKSAGVDMTTPAPFRAFVKAMNDIMDQIEEILDRQS